LQAFTGIGNDYQPPAHGELTLDTLSRSVADLTDEIERMLAKTSVLFDDLVDLAANI
jgi:bifunctional enzyme CysN/CysC